MMAASWFKLVLVAIVASCAMQHAFAAPSAVESRNSAVAAVPRELEIIGKTAVELVKVFGEFVKNVAEIILASIGQQTQRTLFSILLKAHAIVTASGLDDASLELSVDEMKEYRIVAKAAMRLRQRLDTMERTEEILESTSDEVFDHNISGAHFRRSSSALTAVLKYFYTRLDERLKEQPQLRSTYVTVRENIADEYKNVDLNLVALTKLKRDAISAQIIHKMMVITMNKQFLHHAFRRMLLKEEYFVWARSTLELAKKSNNLQTVQQIYDESLAEAAPTVDSDYGTVWDIQKALFGKLKEKFEKSPALNQELRIIQKNVANKQDWDRKSIWELDIVPL